MSDYIVVQEVDLSTRQTVAETILPSLEWIDGITGYCACPGQHKHTTPEGDRDCRVKLDGVPTVSCVHQSCAEEIKSANKSLRDALKSSAPVAPSTQQKKQAAAKAKFEKQLKERTKKSLPSLLKNYAWPYDKIIADSPIQIPSDDRLAMIQTFIGMFAADDVVWIGDVSSTGQSHHVVNFKTSAEWLAGEIPAGPFTCPSCFVPGTYSRSKDRVSGHRYLVVESDSLKKNEVGAIFHWLEQAVGIRLRAVVDTAGKSLHGWFEYPPDDILAELKIMLPALGCDPKMFGASQPCRLPGGSRDGRVQRLIYAAKGGAQ